MSLESNKVYKNAVLKGAFSVKCMLRLHNVNIHCLCCILNKVHAIRFFTNVSLYLKTYINHQTTFLYEIPYSLIPNTTC